MANMSKSLALVLVAIFLISLVTFSSVPVKASPKTITVPDDFPTINSAIGNATQGDTILVKSGTYNEQTLKINKQLTLTSDIPYQATISLHPTTYTVNFYGTPLQEYNDSIDIYSDNVKLIGFTIVSDGGDFSANGNHIQIINNTFGTQKIGISLNVNGDENQVIGNNLSRSSLSITGDSQTVTDNNVAGIRISGSFNVVTRNKATTMSITGFNNTIVGNSFIVPWEGSGVGIGLTNANYNLIANNTEIGSNVGIAIGYPNQGSGSYNTFSGNLIEEAALWGILLGNGSSNIFYGNLIANNGGAGHDGYGLVLGGTITQANNNQFFLNVFTNNSKNFGTNWQVIGSNSFDNGIIGNYWDDYLTKYPNAIEIANSGLGNTPYLVYSNYFDNYPIWSMPDFSKMIPALPNPWAPALPEGATVSVNPTITPTPSISPAAPSTPPPTTDNQNSSFAQNTSSNNQITTNPNVPEISWFVVLPLLLSLFSVAVVLRNRKTAKPKLDA